MSRFTVYCFALSVMLAGCSSPRPAWHDDPDTASPAYWAEQPAVVEVIANDYAALWEAAEEARRRFGFEAAMTDYRGGLLTTEPKISPQFFEVWHTELRSPSDVAESSLATIRRRLRLQFQRLPGGRYGAQPKVIVERLALAERRITTAIEYRATLGLGEQQQFGPGIPRAPGRYWYAIGRDEKLERAIADRMARRLQ